MNYIEKKDWSILTLMIALLSPFTRIRVQSTLSSLEILRTRERRFLFAIIDLLTARPSDMTDFQKGHASLQVSNKNILKFVSKLKIQV